MWFIFPQLAGLGRQPHRAILRHHLASTRRAPISSIRSSGRAFAKPSRRCCRGRGNADRRADPRADRRDEAPLEPDACSTEVEPDGVFATRARRLSSAESATNARSHFWTRRAVRQPHRRKALEPHAQASVRPRRCSACISPRPPPRSRSATKAPDFTTTGAVGGKEFKLHLAEQLKKGPVVLYFFPKAFTSGCTAEAHAFSEAIGDFKKAGAQVIGMSADNLRRCTTSRPRNAAALSRSRPRLLRPRRPMTSPGPRIPGSRRAPPTSSARTARSPWSTTTSTSASMSRRPSRRSKH